MKESTQGLINFLTFCSNSQLCGTTGCCFQPNIGSSYDKCQTNIFSGATLGQCYNYEIGSAGNFSKLVFLLSSHTNTIANMTKHNFKPWHCTTMEQTASESNPLLLISLMAKFLIANSTTHSWITMPTYKHTPAVYINICFKIVHQQWLNRRENLLNIEEITNYFLIYKLSIIFISLK